MTLTPTLKFLIVAFASAVVVIGWVWTGIKVDALALGMNEHAYNIGLVVISSLSTAASGLLVYLGLKAPVKGEVVVPTDEAITAPTKPPAMG